jgi:hypothetical protein
MKNIDQITSDNMGGLQVCYYTDWDNVDWTQFPRLNGLRLVGDIILKPGKTWGRIRFTFRTAGFNQPPKTDRRGTIYTHDIKGFLPKDSLEVSELMYQMNGQPRYAVLHQDFNGNLKLSGSQDYGLGFESRLSTKNGPDGLNGYEAGFTGESLMPAYFYAGAIALSDQTIPGPPSSGSGEPVLIKDGAGNILATVQPGGVFEITSGFSFGFRILT